MIQAIIFDFDGVMINSEELAFEAYQDLLAPLGRRLTAADFRAIIGLDLEATARYVAEAAGLDEDINLLAERHWKRTLEIMETRLEPMPGLETLVGKLQGRGLRLGIASNSPTASVRRSLGQIGYLPAFPVVVGRDEVGAGKPAPDVYLEAARRLGAHPPDCLAIEDSAVGLQAALSAGMRCAVLTLGQPPNPAFQQADGVYPDLRTLAGEVDHLLNGALR